MTESGPAGLSILATAIAARLAAFNAQSGGHSRTVKSMVLLTEPPSLDAGEITDKGYINQGAVLSQRAEAVDALYSDEGSPRVLKLS